MFVEFDIVGLCYEVVDYVVKYYVVIVVGFGQCYQMFDMFGGFVGVQVQNYLVFGGFCVVGNFDYQIGVGIIGYIGQIFGMGCVCYQQCCDQCFIQYWQLF